MAFAHLAKSHPSHAVPKTVQHGHANRMGKETEAWEQVSGRKSCVGKLLHLQVLCQMMIYTKDHLSLEREQFCTC